MKKIVRAEWLAWLAAAIAAFACGCSSDAPAPNESAVDSAVAQTVRANSTTLRSIEPADTDFSDLEAFGRAIGDKRIVILGEPTHGDGDIFKLKARLVEYLHQAKGFDVLIMESGMFDMARVQERHVAEGKSYSALTPGRMFFMYSRTDDGQRVLKYLDSTQASARPLQFAGFDISMGGDSSIRELMPLLTQFLGTRGSALPASADWATYSTLATQVASLVNSAPPDAEKAAAFKRVSAALEAQLCATQTDDFNYTRSPSFWCRVVRSVDAGYETFWGPVALRDRAGGDNVKWLLDHRFAGKKVVLWMHNFHGINGQVFPPSGPTWVSAGARLVQLYGDEVYMALVTAGRGSYDAYMSSASPPVIPALDKTMLEFHLAAANAPQFMAYPQDAADRERIRTLSVFEPNFIALRPSHFGTGYQGVFFLPATRTILPDESTYPLVP